MSTSHLLLWIFIFATKRVEWDSHGTIDTDLEHSNVKTCSPLLPKPGGSPSTLPHGRDEAQGCRMDHKQGWSSPTSPTLPHTWRNTSPWLVSFALWSSTFLNFIVWCKSLWNENIKEPFIKILSVVKSVNCASAHLFLLSIEMAETSDCHHISLGNSASVR